MAVWPLERLHGIYQPLRPTTSARARTRSVCARFGACAHSQAKSPQTVRQLNFSGIAILSLLPTCPDQVKSRHEIQPVRNIRLVGAGL
jgi:hypothetical protein